MLKVTSVKSSTTVIMNDVKVMKPLKAATKPLQAATKPLKGTTTDGGFVLKIGKNWTNFELNSSNNKKVVFK